MVHDSLGRLTSIWIGTDDTPGSSDDEWSPTNNGGDMVEVSACVYDDGGVGDSNLTEEVNLPAGNGDSAANFRVIVSSYDWRDRVVNTKQGALVRTQSTEPTSGQYFQIGGLSDWIVFDPSDEAADSTTIRGIIHFRYDNLDSVLEQDVFAGNDVLLSNVSDAGVSVRRAAIRSSAPRSFTRMTTASDCRIRSSTSSVSRMAAARAAHRIGTVSFNSMPTTTSLLDGCPVGRHAFRF